MLGHVSDGTVTVHPHQGRGPPVLHGGQPTRVRGNSPWLHGALLDMDHGSTRIREGGKSKDTSFAQAYGNDSSLSCPAQRIKMAVGQEALGLQPVTARAGVKGFDEAFFLPRRG